MIAAALMDPLARIEKLEKQIQLEKQNTHVLNTNISKLSRDFEKLFEVMKEVNKTVVEMALEKKK